MSPLWRDELTIGFAPGRLELVRRARGRKPRVVHAAAVEFSRRREGGWAAGIVALGRALADARWQRARCRLIVSNQLARFALIDAPAELADDEERSAYVALRYRTIYGGRAEDWHSTFAPFGRGERSIACAIDSALFEALGYCAGRAGLELVSMRPHLISAFNQVAGAVPGSNAWFVTVENGRVAMAAFNEERWVGVRNEPLRGGIAESVADLLAQDALARDLPEGECVAFVHAPGWAGELIAPGPGWSMRRVAAGAASRGRGLDAAAFPLTVGARAAA